MNTRTITIWIIRTAVAMALVATPATAQTTGKNSTASEQPVHAPERAQKTATEQSQPSSDKPDEAITLSVFEVRADPNDSYEALNTTSITGTAKNLSQLPLTAEIFTEAAMRDLAITDVNELLRDYASGMGSGIPGGTSADRGEGAQEGDRVVGTFQMRGINVGAPRRNGLLGGIGMLYDNYSYGRTEIIRGPQALLYGAGVAAGVINTMTKRAIFGRHALELANQVDSEGTVRFTLDANADAKIKDRAFAVRINAVSMRKEYWRDNLSTNTDGIAAAVTIRPFRTLTLTGEYEYLARVDVNGRAQFNLRDQNSPYNNILLPVLLANGTAGGVLGGQLRWENVNSFGGDFAANEAEMRVWGATVEYRPASWLSAQVQTAGLHDDQLIGTTNPAQGLFAPTMPTNPTGKWAVAYNPQVNDNLTTQRALRGTIAADFNLGGKIKNQLAIGAERKASRTHFAGNLYYRTDANGDIIINPAARFSAQDGRTAIPLQWVPVEGDISGPFTPSMQTIVVTDGTRYQLAPIRTHGLVAPTAGNPFGVNPNFRGSFFQSKVREEGYFGALFTSWFDGRIDTLVGYRLDNYTREFAETGLSFEVSEASRNLGLVYHLTKSWALYYGTSDSYNPPPGIQKDYNNMALPTGRGTGDEAGIKFSLFDDHVSGSLAFYRLKSKGEIQQPGGQVLRISDPAGINGTLTPAGQFAFAFDRKSEGIELTMTAKPTANLRVRFSYSHVNGVEGNDVRLPIRYNDEFHTNSAGQVTYSDGTVLTVRSPPSNPNSALIPLTVAMMKDPNSPHRAQLDPDSGRINNAVDLGLTTSLPNGATVGTGRLGLPVSQHQLGFVPPGGDTFLAKGGGDPTTGYPVDSANVTANYRFPQKNLKGLGVGTNLNARFNQRAYFYTDAAGGGQRVLKMWGDQVTVNAFLSYERRLSQKVRWSSQLNVNNVFDAIDIRLYNSIGNGIVTWATYSGSPRRFIWTNTLSF